MSRSIRFTRIVSMTEQIAGDLQRLHFSSFHPPASAWEPAVNVYARDDRMEVCVDLAGVAKQDIQVEVEPRRLVFRGHRKLPQGMSGDAGCCRILAMEIPDGEFERVLEFQAAVDPDQVSARQENGWLWITLPLAARNTIG